MDKVRQVPLDMEKLIKIHDALGAIVDGEDRPYTITAITLLLMNLSDSNKIDFKQTLYNVESIEKQMRETLKGK